jgi:hypothetical protein
MPPAPGAPSAGQAIDAVDHKLDRLQDRHRAQRRKATPDETLLSGDAGHTPSDAARPDRTD